MVTRSASLPPPGPLMGALSQPAASTEPCVSGELH